MKKMISSKAKRRMIFLVAAIFLTPTHSALAQINIGGVTINLPKRAKTPKPENPETKREAPAETPSEKTTERTTNSTATNKASGVQKDVWLEIILEEINKRKKEVETYDPSERSELVTMSTPELFHPAISLRARERYYKSVQLNETRRSALDSALDSLAAAAAKKLPLYKPNPSLFAFRNPAAEQMMIRSLRNGAAIKVHKIGVKEATWLTEKNEFGIPLDRYRHGFIWARDNNDDHPYCHLYTVFLQQNYAGGGTYGELFAKLSDDVIFGCP